MKSLIKAKLKAVSLALLFACTAGMAHARETNQSMGSSEMTDTMGTKELPYVIPEKPEDISPLLNGEKIPVAMLPDASGKKVDLNKVVSAKPTVLIIYRGGWCPYCSKQLSGLQQAIPELEKMGYQLVAISTDAPAGLTQSVTKEKLSYTLLSDADLKLSRQLGIAFKAPKAYWEMLPKTTDGKNADLLLPVPSVFILDKSGVIHFEYINPDFRQRLSPDLLKAAAASIKKDL
jgi:peroxiredoxin